jgi:hypothetical protein
MKRFHFIDDVEDTLNQSVSFEIVQIAQRGTARGAKV